MSLLEVRGMTKRFGGLVAVDNVHLDLDRGHVTALIGPNGAGKTTLFNCLTGLLAPDEGTLHLDGEDLSQQSPHRRAAAGLGRTFQRLEVFQNMTVFGNLQVAAEASTPGRIWRGLVSFRHHPEQGIVSLVESTLERVGLQDLRDERAGDLSTGRLRSVELGRALCTRPKALLLDEPASGLDSTETEDLERLLLGLADEGLAVLLVEHDVDMVLEICERIYCLDHGRLIANGTPDEIRADSAVRNAYLGDDEEHADAAAT